MVKRYQKKDPYLEREQEKYPNPIPSREFIIDFLEEIGKSVTWKNMFQAFGLKSDENKEALRRRLRAMERDGQIISNRKGQYALVDSLELLKGRVIARRDGYGFVVPDDASDDIYLSPYQMRTVFPDDIVLVRISGFDSRGRREGNIVEVLERNTQQVVGFYREEEGLSYVEPEKKNTQQNILIPVQERNGAANGQIVVAGIISQPTQKRQATGKIIEILGNHMAPGLEIEVAIRSYELPYKWSEDLQKEVDEIKQGISEDEIKFRKDLRHLAFVTIDGEDAKDFDDAVYCERNKKNWRLFVAIADVSHYVLPDSFLDKEALTRGNSVYFPNRVIPMLPEELSNGICSLKPNEDRLCLVCEMDVSDKGTILDYRFYESVIRSQARLTYTQVAELLDGGQEHALLPHLKELNNLFRKLHQQRALRGALDFDTLETKIIFAENRKIKKIIPSIRNDAHRLIEELMLLANVSAANFLKQHGFPVLYRVHKGPDADRLENLKNFLRGLGLKIGGGENPTPKDYATLLQKIKDRADKHIIQTVLLRSLKQAVYSPVDEGHFGLAYDTYCHFTSPIRRYPDLLIHRTIRHILDKDTKKHFFYDTNRMFTYGDHCSMTERRADDATRDVTDWLKCEFMLDKLGQEFEGIISEVTGFGVFVELKDIYVEGLIHITALKNDYYHFDAIRRSLTGKRSGKTYHLGDKLRVRVVRVDLDEKQIDFALITKAGDNKKVKTPSKSRKSKPKSSRKTRRSS